MPVSSSIIAVILTALISEYILTASADLLNVKGIRQDLSPELTGIYDPQEYRKSQDYLRATAFLRILSSTVSLIMLLLFWFFRGFSLLDGSIRALNLSELFSGLLFIGILLLLKSLMTLPFSVYSTFIIEERFGFNKTTPKTFFMDILKGTAISILLGGVLLSAILLFFQYAGNNAWWLCWLATSLFTLAVQYVVPTVIMPLFNKFTPLEDGELRSAIFQYAESIEFPLENIFIMDGSRRSSKSNAFFTGFGKNKRIVLFDTLVEQHSVDELVAVLAHEMGHFKKRHISLMMAIGIIQAGLVFYLLSVSLTCRGLFDAFFMQKGSIYAGLVFFGMLYSPIAFFSDLLIQKISRNNEFSADKFAADTTGGSMNIKNALKKLSASNLSNLVPHPLYVVLNYSHPPLLQRLRALDDARQS